MKKSIFALCALACVSPLFADTVEMVADGSVLTGLENSANDFIIKLPDGASSGSATTAGRVVANTLVIRSGVTFTSATASWISAGSNGNSIINNGLTIEAGATFNSGRDFGEFTGSSTYASGGMRVGAGISNISGNLVVNGYRYNPVNNMWNGDNYAFDARGTQFNVYAGATITQKGVSHKDASSTMRAINKITAKEFTIHNGVAKNALMFDEFVFLNNTALNMHSSNTIVSGAAYGATSQADSTFYATGNVVLASYNGAQNEIGTIKTVEKSELKFISDASSKLDVSLIDIITADLADSASGKINLKLNFADESLRIANLRDLLDSGRIDSLQIYLDVDGTTKYVDAIEGVNFKILDNGWLTTAIPEPATYAAIFGAAALAFALRRRK